MSGAAGENARCGTHRRQERRKREPRIDTAPTRNLLDARAGRPAHVHGLREGGIAVSGQREDEVLWIEAVHHARRALAGLGAFVETVVQGDFYLDNANLLKAPGYAVVNANLRYATDLTGGYAKRLSLYVEVRNLFDTTYVASAQNLANGISGTTGLQNGAAVLATTTGSVFAGAPRNIVGGMRLAF